MRRPLSALLAFGLWVGAPSAAMPAGGDGVEARLAALARAHDGRFAQARERLGEIPTEPGDPRTPFFLAYVDYWELLYDPDNTRIRERFEDELLRTIALAEKLPADRSAEAGTWGGTARLLLAQLRAWERHPVGAAFEAGRAKRTLERVAREDGSLADPLFALGTYNYMADRVSTFVKGIRALLFLPRGDERLGLEQLERAAAESTYFRRDARLLLVTVHSHRKERRYADARREVERALREAGDTVAVRHAAARLDLTLALPESAAAHLDRAIADAAADPPAAPSVRAALELLRARADMALFRPDLASRRLEILVADAQDLPRSVRDDGAALLAEARSILAEPSWERVRGVVAADGPAGGAAGAEPAVRLAEQHPSDPAAALVAGRALLQASAPDRAIVWLRKADAAAAELPPSWIGPCRLMAGQALDLQGKRAEAVAYYRLAAEGAPFPGRDAARFWQTTPYPAGT